MKGYELPAISKQHNVMPQFSGNETETIKMNRTELFDKILQELYCSQDNYLIVSIWGENEFEITDDKIYDSILSELYERDWIKSFGASQKDTVMINYNGKQIVEKYGSYSSFLRDLKKSDNKDQVQKKTDRILNNITRISAIFLGVSSFILSYNKFFIDDVKIEKQKTEIESLNNKIDSLNLEKLSRNKKPKA